MPLNPVPNWPASGLDSLPDPTSATYTDDNGFELDLLLQLHNAILEATEAKIGSEDSLTNVLLNYVRLHDGTSKGLYVPLSALVGESLIANTNFDIWQRTAGASVSSTTTFDRMTSFCADRIFVLPVGATVAQARSTTVPDAKSQYSLAVTGAASVTTVDIGQRIRSALVNTRCQQSLLFSCYVRNESGGAYTPNLMIGTPGSVDNFGTVTNRLTQALQSCADSAWTRVHHVFDPTAYTNILNGMQVALQIPSGSSVSGDTNRIAQFDLRPGTQYRGFSAPDPDFEERRCLPYFCKTFPRATAVAQNSGTELGALAYTVWVGVGSNFAIPWRFPLPMVKAPTVTFYNPSAANGNWRNITDGADSGAPFTSNLGDAGLLVYNTQQAADGVSERIAIHAIANAELT